MLPTVSDQFFFRLSIHACDELSVRGFNEQLNVLACFLGGYLDEAVETEYFHWTTTKRLFWSLYQVSAFSFSPSILADLT